MTAHLLLITIGPVQDFIAQARRTRDLWYGSHILSELGRAAARALVAADAKLIFPALGEGDPELEPCLAPLRYNDNKSPQSIANKLLAEIPSSVNPEPIARLVRETVMNYWSERVTAPVKANCAGLLAAGIDDVWDEQVKTFVEFAASWAELGDYADTRRQVEQAISARKMLRDFGPWLRGRGSVPKSSLDGGRETVLLPSKKRQTRLVRRYRITDGEQLDAVGLVKRTGGEPEQFVPIVNVALASWVELASRVADSELEKLRKACASARVSSVRRDLPCVTPFPFDASVLLRSRLSSVVEEQGLEIDVESWGREYLRPVFEKVAEPHPYVACLVADGDRMGRVIDRLGSAEAHRSFSAELAGFATEARMVVEQQHRGVLVYAGGDDVLAFLPLPEVLGCAEGLRASFDKSMASTCSSLPMDERPTLSIGVGIGHVMESMGELLDLGRRSEREAKRDRNSLAVIVDKRSGGTRSWRARWSEDPVRLLLEGVELLQGRLSSRKVYEIATTIARLPKPSESVDSPLARLLELEIRHSLGRVEGGSLTPDQVGLDLEAHFGYTKLHARIDQWVTRLLIARTFAQAQPCARHREEEAVV